MTSLTDDEIVDQVVRLDDKVKEFTGYLPTYVRLPYLEYDDRVLNILKDRGYYIIGMDLDTRDWMYHDPCRVEESLKTFIHGLESGGTITLVHEVYECTVNRLVPMMLEELQKRDLARICHSCLCFLFVSLFCLLAETVTAVTIGECLGHPKENWYRKSPSQSEGWAQLHIQKYTNGNDASVALPERHDL